MSVQCIRGVCRNRRQVHRNLWNPQRSSKSLVGLAGIAADKLAGPIHHHLRSVDAVQAKVLGVGTLPLTIEAGRVRVLPADMVPVVHVFAEDNHFRARYWLPIERFEKPVCWRAAGTPLRCEKFHQHWSANIRAST